MKKTIFFSFLFFVVGVGLATTILTNPLHWEWTHAIQDGVSGL